MRHTQIEGVVEGEQPILISGGTPTTTDTYYISVTRGGVGGTAEITITSDLGDDVAAAAISSGSPVDLGTGGGTLVVFFKRLTLGDQWTIKTYDDGVILQPVSNIGNKRGPIQAARVGRAGGLLTQGAPDFDVVTIEDGESLASTAFRAAGYHSFVFRMSAAWTAADIAFQVALHPNGSFDTLRDNFGNIVTVAVSAGDACGITGTAAEALGGAPWVKLVSVDSSDPTSEVSQSGGDRNIIICKAG